VAHRCSEGRATRSRTGTPKRVRGSDNERPPRRRKECCVVGHLARRACEGIASVRGTPEATARHDGQRRKTDRRRTQSRWSGIGSPYSGKGKRGVDHASTKKKAAPIGGRLRERSCGRTRTASRQGEPTGARSPVKGGGSHRALKGGHIRKEGEEEGKGVSNTESKRISGLT